MKILKRYTDEAGWEETTIEECVEHTEGALYWKPDTVLKMIADGQEVRTPFAYYKKAD